MALNKKANNSEKDFSSKTQNVQFQKITSFEIYRTGVTDFQKSKWPLVYRRKLAISDTIETKSWYPIDLDVITSEKQKTDVGLTGVFHYKNRMSYGFVKKIRWNYFDFFQDNNEADETLKVRHSKKCKNVFLHRGDAVLLRKEPVKLLNIVAPSKQF